MRGQRGFVWWISLLQVLAVVVVVYGIYYAIDHSWETTAGIERGETTKQAEWDKAKRDQRDIEEKAAAAATTKLEVGNGKAKIVYRTITQQVDRVVTRDVYRNVCLDADGLRLATDAINGKSPAAGEPDRTAPPAPATDRRNGGIALALDRGGFGADLRGRP